MNNQRKASKHILVAALVLAGLGAVAKAAQAYWACVSSYDGCTFSIQCIEYDDRTHKKTGNEFSVEFQC